MFNLKDFEGEVAKKAKVDSGIMTIGDMVDHLLKEIAFYGCGFGWTTASDEAEEIHVIFHYTEKTHGLSSNGYITNLKIMIGAEIRYQQRTAKTFKAIEGFSWNLDITNDEEVFALILRKM